MKDREINRSKHYNTYTRKGIITFDQSEKAGVGLRFIRELEQGKKSLRLDKVNQVLNLFGREVGVVSIDRDKL